MEVARVRVTLRKLLVRRHIHILYGLTFQDIGERMCKVKLFELITFR